MYCGSSEIVDNKHQCLAQKLWLYLNHNNYEALETLKDNKKQKQQEEEEEEEKEK